MENGVTNPDMPCDKTSANLDAIEQELDALFSSKIPSVVEDSAEEKPGRRRKGHRRDTEDRWLDEAENMLKKGEAEDSKWLDDAERDIDALLQVNRKASLSSKVSGPRRQSIHELELSPMWGKDGGSDKEKEASQVAVEKAEKELHDAEAAHGKDSVEVAHMLLHAAEVYTRARQLTPAEFCAHQACHLLTAQQGATSCDAIQATIRLLHIYALEEKWPDVDQMCAAAMKWIATAPVLTADMKALVDQISDVAKIKCMPSIRIA